jgi:two-component system chemotaxis response regulator CheB
VIGVVLTGNLDDGTAGLSAIKRSGGVAVVQDPDEAPYPSMPGSALRNVFVDHRVRLAEIVPLLVRLVEEGALEAASPAALLMEEKVAESDNDTDRALDEIGTHSPVTCPECGGSLWELKDEEPLRYRCHEGHALSVATLLAEQDGRIEEALWAAVRHFDEHAMMCERLVRRAGSAGRDAVRDAFAARAGRARRHAADLRAVLDTLEPGPSGEETSP